MRWIKRKILNIVLAKLFMAITEDDIIPLKDLEDGQKKELAEEARLIKGTQLWTRMRVEVKTKAQKRMFAKSISWDDMYFGKAVLHVIEILDKRLEAISKIKY